LSELSRLVAWVGSIGIKGTSVVIHQILHSGSASLNFARVSAILAWGFLGFPQFILANGRTKLYPDTGFSFFLSFFLSFFFPPPSSSMHMTEKFFKIHHSDFFLSHCKIIAAYFGC
jgi:hypothetical protein